ncbi:GDSL-type esterase/lipase family protein [Bacillus horti]|uniref:Lysophospholipase L1-like esterase n=1 Tax=Caldalkalibacillus horti TaxID=77523 RepID=A0ABT9W1B4_9BACI|nr:GDSL-type esterase/lipase family protein [Bacillus horti]MDQ0167024.1 lysophospholipase L1-like esterase [Bacillus horti]
MSVQKETENQRLLYVAFGNSLTLGVGAGYAPGFVQRYRCLAETELQRRVIGRIYARSGATAGEIATFLDSYQAEQAIKHASIITISAGGNDLILAAKHYLQTKDKSRFTQALSESQAAVAKMLTIISTIKATQAKPYIIRLLGLYNPLPEIALGDKWVQAFNSGLHGFSNKNIRVANVFSAFKGNERELLSQDRVHPNAKGYEVIANTLHQLGYAPLI